jgi:hypothetical protein
LFISGNNTYYYSRPVPLGMQCHYGSKRIVKSLKARFKRTALGGSNQKNFQLETYWCSIRVEQIAKGYVSAPVAKVFLMAVDMVCLMPKRTNPCAMTALVRMKHLSAWIAT